MRQIIFIFTLVAMSALALANDQPLINISAEGKIKAQPDIASFYLTVQTTELNANKARDKTDSEVKKLLKLIEKFEIKEGSLDTSQTSIQSEYDYSSKPRKLLGYRASREMSFKLTELQQVELLVVEISELNFTNLNNIQFSIQDSQYLEDLALINAIQIAKQKAELIANEFGVNLGGLYKINHQVSQSSPPVFARAMALESNMSKTDSYEQKDIEMSAFIEVSFQLK